MRIETTNGVQVREFGLARGYLSSSEPIAHFGLGEIERIERLSITWPSGRRQSFTDLSANRRYVITEAETGSSGPTPEVAAPQFVEVASMVGLNVKQTAKPIDELAAQPLLPFDSMGWVRGWRWAMSTEIASTMS